MMDTEAFKEFKTGLTLLRDNYANRALNHIQRAAELEKNNPYYMSYLGVALARTQQKWADAERLCDGAVRIKRNQAQLYLNLAEVYLAPRRPHCRHEVCPSRCPVEHRHGQADAAQAPRIHFPGPQASAEPAFRSPEAQDPVGPRQGLSHKEFPHPPNAERADGFGHPPFS